MKKLLFLPLLAAAAFAQTASFPSAIVSTSQLMRLANRVQSQASVAIAPSDTTIHLTSAARFLTPGLVTIDSEVIAICDKSGNDLTVGFASCPSSDGRGFDSSTAASHTINSVASMYVDAWHHNAVTVELVALETFLGVNGVNVMQKGTTSGASGATLCLDGNGKATTSGCASSGSAAYSVTRYQWTRSQSGTVSIGSNTITVAPCPDGYATGLPARLTGGTGSPAADTVTITGGTCTSGATSGTMTFTAAVARTGSWSIGTATAGIFEAAQAAGALGAVYFAPGTYNLYATVTFPYDGQTFFGDSSDVVKITAPNSANVQRFFVVGARSDITISRLGFDGNFANQTYTPTTYINAIDGSSSTRLRIENCKFHAFGYNVNTDAPYATAIGVYGADDVSILGNKFLSIWGSEIVLNPVHGARIDGNTFGAPQVSDSQSNVNAWDTYSGGFGIFSASSDHVTISNNTMYGCQRSASLNSYGNLVGVNGSGGPTGTYFTIQNNRFYGLGNGRGTVAVTNGSGTITGTGTAFQSSLDVGRTFKVEGDATEYKITAVASSTSLTVTPTIARATASGLRYQYQNSGDAIAVYNVLGLTVTGNVVYDSGDNGYDVAGSDANSVGQVVFANNQAVRSQNDGLFLGGATFNVQVSDNIFLNNGRGALSGHQAGIEMSPTNQGQTSARAMWHITIEGNTCIDDQNTATQLYCVQTEAAAAASIVGNTLAGNTFYTYNGGVPIGSFFDAGTTSANQGKMFSAVSVSSALRLTPIAYADLSGLVSLANGTLVDCYDCNAYCTAGSSTGAICAYQNSAWTPASTQAPKQLVNYIATESGANNAIAATLTGVSVADGLCVTVQLAHTLQAGSNTFNLNGGGAVAIKSSRNTANNIGTAYAATGRVRLCYNSTGPLWLDMAQ